MLTMDPSSFCGHSANTENDAACYSFISVAYFVKRITSGSTVLSSIVLKLSLHNVTVPSHPAITERDIGPIFYQKEGEKLLCL